MPFSTDLANKMLDHTFVNTAFTAPTAWWVQLHYGDPTAVCTADAWAAAGRKLVADWTNSTAATLSNVAAIAWDDLPDPGIHSTISHVSIHSLVSGGSPYGYCALTTSRYVATGDTLTIDIGAIDISVS